MKAALKGGFFILHDLLKEKQVIIIMYVNFIIAWFNIIIISIRKTAFILIIS